MFVRMYERFSGKRNVKLGTNILTRDIFLTPSVCVCVCVAQKIKEQRKERKRKEAEKT